MRALVGIEVEKILRRRLNQVVLAVSTVLLIVVYVLLWLATDVVSEVGAGDPEAVQRLRSSLYLEETVPFAILMLYFVGFVAGVVVIGANVGSEYTWNTVRTFTSVEPRRGLLLLAKLIALLATLVVGLLFGLAVMVATSAVITLVAGEFDLSFVDGEYLRESAASFGKLVVGTSPYFGLAFLLGVVGRSPTAGIALALGVAFLEGIVGGLMVLAGGWLADVTKFMLDQNGDNLALTEAGPFGQVAGGQGSALEDLFDRPSVEHSIIVLLVWTAVFLALSFWAFRRQDLEYQGG